MFLTFHPSYTQKDVQSTIPLVVHKKLHPSPNSKPHIHPNLDNVTPSVSPKSVHNVILSKNM